MWWILESDSAELVLLLSRSYHKWPMASMGVRAQSSFAAFQTESLSVSCNCHLSTCSFSLHPDVLEGVTTFKMREPTLVCIEALILWSFVTMSFRLVKKLQSFGLNSSQTQSWIRSWHHKILNLFHLILKSGNFIWINGLRPLLNNFQSF